MILRTKNNSGIILFVVLWIMVILTLLTIGLGWQTHVELTLAKNFKGKIQSKYLALSGLNYAIDVIKKDKNNKDLHKPDIFNLQIISKQIPLETGYFQVASFIDEESKININAISQNNYQILVNLLQQLGVDQETATTVSCSVIDWIDNDNDIFNSSCGAENSYYQDLGYNSKNQPFDSVEEMLLLRGMNKNIFQKIKNFITIYPAHGAFLIDIDTAPEEILKAFAESFVGAQTNTGIEDANSLVRNIMEYRKTLTDSNATTQERAIEANKINLNPKENTIFLMMQAQRQRSPQYFNIHVIGTDQLSQASTEITATLQRNDFSVLSWHRN